MSKNRRIKKAVSVVAATTMIAGIVPASAFSAYAPVSYVWADEQNQEASQSKVRDTVWGSAEIGEHSEEGSFTYDKTTGSITVNGSGNKFDKDKGSDNLYYAFCNAKGDVTITAKMKATGSADSSSQAGIMLRNASDDAESQTEALYADFGKSQIRYGRHGSKNGASSLGKAAVDSEVYLKIEIKDQTVNYYVSATPDFAEAVTKTETLSGIDTKTVGFFATKDTTATFSDISIKESYTQDDGTSVEKVVYDSSIGELTPAYSSSADYSGNYDSGNEFSTSADGNVLKVTHKRSAAKKGNLREDTGMDYLLFPSTKDDMTITADVTINSVDSGTDKQGFAMGEFVAEKGSATAVDALHFQKNLVFQHTYSTELGKGGCGDPKVSNIEVGATYTITYTKKENKADFKVVAADGTVMLDSAEAGTTIDLTGDTYYKGLASGNAVQYGFAFSGVEADISNVKLLNTSNEVVYDMNDYYIAEGVAPEISNVKASVAEDRESIELSWDIDKEGSGNVKYSVFVSKDGGDYTKAGDTKVNSFSFTKMNGDGKYTFKVVPYGSETKGEEAAANEVTYQTPLAKTTLKAEADDTKAVLNWDAIEGAESYEVYRSLGSTGKKELIATVKDAAYTDSSVKAEEPYYYYVVAKNADNYSNPSDIVQVLTSKGHTGAYVYENEAVKLNVEAKSNDTVFADNASVTLSADKDGKAKLVVNGKEVDAKEVKAGEKFTFDMSLVKGRNDVEILYTDSENKTTRKTFNFVSNPKYDIVVDAAYTGEDGAITDGYATYKTVQAAVNSVAEDNAESKVIFIKNGEYEERVEVKSPNVSLLGEDAQKTHLFYSVCVANGNADSMWNRNAMYVDSTADGFTAENLTIENSYAYTNGSDQQADALCIVADKTACINIRLVGYQDTLLTDTRVKDENSNYEVTRQYFEKCYITGNVDFIYGAGTSVFKDCDIVARYTEYKADGCFTAGRTYAATQYGYVFDNCRFLAEDNVADGSYRMARPWGADDSTTFINCYLGRAISTAEGTSYGDMSGNLAKNARFAEYGSYGPGYVVNNTRPLLTSEEAKSYDVNTVFGDYDVQAAVKTMYGAVVENPSNPSDTVKPSEEESKESENTNTNTEAAADGVKTADVHRTGLFALLAGIAGMTAAFSGKKKKEEYDK